MIIDRGLAEQVAVLPQCLAPNPRLPAVRSERERLRPHLQRNHCSHGTGPRLKLSRIVAVPEVRLIRAAPLRNLDNRPGYPWPVDRLPLVAASLGPLHTDEFESGYCEPVADWRAVAAEAAKIPAMPNDRDAIGAYTSTRTCRSGPGFGRTARRRACPVGCM